MLNEIEALVREHYGLNDDSVEEEAAEDEAPKAKRGKKPSVVNEDDEDILIIPSDAYSDEE